MFGKCLVRLVLTASVLFAAARVNAQEILPITGSDIYFCRYEVDATTSLLKLSGAPATYQVASVGKELAQLKRRRSATRERLQKQKALLKSIPNRLQLEGRRNKVKGVIQTLTNEESALRALEANIRRCRDRQLIQSGSMTISIVKVTNTVSGQFFITAYASRPGPLRVSKNVVIGAGEWCLTFNGSGVLPFNYPSGTEAQIRLSDSICPEGGNVRCEPAIPANHIGWRIYTAFNPPNPTSVMNQFAGQIGDLSITARPFVSGVPCIGVP